MTMWRRDWKLLVKVAAIIIAVILVVADPAMAVAGVVAWLASVDANRRGKADLVGIVAVSAIVVQAIVFSVAPLHDALGLFATIPAGVAIGCGFALLSRRGSV